MAISANVHLENKGAIDSLSDKTRIAIAGASKTTINKSVNRLNTKLGRAIPFSVGTQITGFRRVRTKKNLATKRKPIGKLWFGGNSIAAKFAGKPRQVKGGVAAGRLFFSKAFIPKFKSGYRGVFRHGDNGKIYEVTIPINEFKRMINEASNNEVSNIQVDIYNDLKKRLK